MPEPQMTQGWGEAIAAALGALGGGAASWFKVRGVRPEVERLRKNLHNTSDVAQAAILRVALVEKGMSDIDRRLGRIEEKLDRLVERER